MTRFAWITAGLTAIVGMFVGMAVTGPAAPGESASPRRDAGPAAVAEAPIAAPVVRRPADVGGPPTGVNFADIVERLNPAVVNIEASARGRRLGLRSRSGGLPPRPDIFEDPSDDRRRGETLRQGAGTGFLIDAAGHLLTNHHVIEGAERIVVKLADGRSLRARYIGSDPDTDIALLKVDAPAPLVHATLGDSDALRVGEWVCAIGNPLAYEHTVTVGVVSFIGRKLFDPSLDNYIQTDAAITFGNSGGPLINTRGEVIGINSAISRQVSNIGFAVPINQARAILPQLLAHGRVARGYIGVALRDVDPDLQVSLGLAQSEGALVQDVTQASPADRAGIRPYDLVTAIDGRAVRSNDALIREIAAREPGSSVRLAVVRDGRVRHVLVKLAERPLRDGDAVPAGPRFERQVPDFERGELGLSLIEIDDSNAHRYDIPGRMTGLYVHRVEPLSAAADAGIARGQVILEINRRPVATVADYRRVVDGARPGDVLAFYVYVPDIAQRSIRAVRVESR
ncbi:MAG: trypsin-like peptidase domain-containing protein [Acidobacteriota bacterium]